MENIDKLNLENYTPIFGIMTALWGEQFRATVKDKSTIKFFVRLVLTYGMGKLITLETKVAKCLLTICHVYEDNRSAFKV